MILVFNTLHKLRAPFGEHAVYISHCKSGICSLHHTSHTGAGRHSRSGWLREIDDSAFGCKEHACN